MIKVPKYQTATLLAAFCAMSLVSTSHAGFSETSTNTHDYQIGIGEEPYKVQTTGDNIINVGQNITGTNPASPHQVDFTGTNNGYWLYTYHPATINYDGKVSINTDKATFQGFSTGSATTLDVNFSNTALLQVTSTGLNTRGFNHSGTGHINFSDFAGTLQVQSGYDDSAASLGTYGLYAYRGDINFDSIAQSGIISVISDSDQTASVFSWGSDINVNGSFAGQVNTISSGYNAYGFYARNDMTINNVSNTSNVNVSGSYNIRGLNSQVGTLYITNDFAGDINIKADKITDPNQVNTHLKSGAMGLAGNGGINIGGSITADSTISISGDGNYASGLHSYSSDINIAGSLAGKILVTAGNRNTFSNAYGLDAKGITLGSMADTGYIRVNADGGYNSGIRASANDIVIAGNLAGDIDVSSTGNANSGIYANHNFTANAVAETSHINVSGYSSVRGIEAAFGSISITNDFAGDITINADKNQVNNLSRACGLSAYQNITIGNLTNKSSISVAATGWDVNGLFAGYGDISIGSVAGNINVESGHQNARGIYAKNNITLNEIADSSNTTVKGNGTYIYGIIAGNQLSIAGDIAGDIIVESQGGKVHGLNAHNGITANAVTENSRIEISAIDDSCGIISGNGSITINQDYAGDIIVNSSNSKAVGISAAQNITMNSLTENSEINVSTPNSYAYGMYAKNGTISLNDLSGSVKVEGATAVYGIYGNTLNLNNISGTVSAVATNTSSATAAIVASGSSDDFVALATGANIVGDINLNGNTSEGDQDTLTLRGSGSYNYNLYNIETLNVEQGDANTKDHTWKLNLDKQDAAGTNRFVNTNINHGLLSVNQNFQTENLTIQNDGGLAFTLTTPTEDIALNVTQNAALAGTLKIANIDNTSISQIGDQYTLIDAAAITGKFDNITGNRLDYHTRLAVLYATDSVTAQTALVGDIDLNGVVNDLDATILAASYGQTGLFSWATGDIDGDGTVGYFDELLLASHYGTSTSSLNSQTFNAAANTQAYFTFKNVPEPSSLALLGMGGLLFVRRRSAS
ncbi:hypothetical protein KS4_16220 [Poriferisphaera corsica]|uniref:Ice-binding protein C-terminal domain-containing protein n=1 Tax=Poriferisphaera corsica TaxID=2528020 RepID=A0A517YTL7_9BACT|nr:PEP-CTERM sorting domain-containing protein [Poriferisphaera corsica]QDU33571.1 hypothetical protein KS4_16220 [Poriferisphaera corsica]